MTTEHTHTEKAIEKLRIGDRRDSLTLVTTILHKPSSCWVLTVNDPYSSLFLSPLAPLFLQKLITFKFSCV